MPKCPETITVSGGNPSYDGPEEEKWEKPKVPKSAEERLHPEIKYSMRSKVFQGHTNQATYNASGNLYTTHPMAGTVDWGPPIGSWLGFFHGVSLGKDHMNEDVEPLHWAVYLDHGITMHLFWGPKTPKEKGPYMKKYYEKRPLC